VLMISGTVGSGKSTATICVARFLRKMGLKVKVTSLTGFHTFCYVFLYVLARLTYRSKDFHELIKKKISPASLVDGRILDKMLKLVVVLEFVSIHIAFLLKIFVPLKFGYDVVVVDEGTVNVVGNYTAFFDASYKRGLYVLILSFLRLVKNISRNATVITFFLDCDNSVLMARWKTRDSPPCRQQPFTPTDYLRYLNCLRNAKNMLKQILDLKVKEVNTTLKSPLDISKLILIESGLLRQ